MNLKVKAQSLCDSWTETETPKNIDLKSLSENEQHHGKQHIAPVLQVTLLHRYRNNCLISIDTYSPAFESTFQWTNNNTSLNIKPNGAIKSPFLGSRHCSDPTPLECTILSCLCEFSKNHCLISIFQYISYRMMHTYFLTSRYTSPPPTAMTHCNSSIFLASSSILLWSTSACLPQQSLTFIFIYWYYTLHYIQPLYWLSLSTILTLSFTFISIPEYPLISLTVSVCPFIAANMKAVRPFYR